MIQVLNQTPGTLKLNYFDGEVLFQGFQPPLILSQLKLCQDLQYHTIKILILEKV